MPRVYTDIRRLNVVLGRIEPRNYSELNVYSPRHSSNRVRVYFNFTSCSLLGPFAARLAAEFIVFVAGLVSASARADLVAVRYWMRYLAHLKSIDALDPTAWTAAQWRLNTTEWWLSIRSDPDISDTTKNAYRSSVERFVRHLQAQNILPHFKLPAKIDRAAHRKKMTLAEVKASDVEIDKIDVPDDVRSALNQLAFLDDLSDSQQVLRRIDIILSAAKSLCEKRVRSFWAEWTAAQRDSQAGKFDPARFLEDFAVSLNPLKLRRGWRGAIDARSNVIRLIEYMYGSMLPSEPSNPILRLVYNEFHVGEIRDLLHSTPNTLVPFVVLILTNDPIEVSSVLSLRTTSLVQAAESSNVRVTYIKKRARYRKIGVVWAAPDDRELRTGSKRRIEPATALNCIKEMREPLVAHAEMDVSDRMFLVSGHGGPPESVKVLDSRILLDAWKRLRNTDAILCRYRFTLDKLRPTLILRSFLASGGDIFAAFYTAQHKLLATTQRYVNEQVSDHISSSSAREVQDALTLQVADKHEQIRPHTGIPPRRAREIVERAARLGFTGYAGKKARVRVENDLVKFSQGQIILIEDPSVAAELLVFKRHLVSELPVLRTSQEFESVWLPLLIFINGCLNALPQDVRHSGEQLAAQMRIAYLDVPHA